MRRAKHLLIGLLALVVLLSFGLVVGSSTLSGTAHAIGSALFASEPSGERVPTPDALIPPQGSAAIKPHITAMGTPAFGPQDVRDYFATTAPPYWDSTTPRPVIEAIEFLSAADVESRLGTSTDRPLGALLCLVTIRGQFVPPVPPGVQLQTRPDPNTLMHLVFDGQTGNLLVFGFPPPER